MFGVLDVRFVMRPIPYRRCFSQVYTAPPHDVILEPH